LAYQIGNRGAGGFCDVRPAVTFRYWRDPLFLATCTAYVLLRWFIKSHVAWPFLQNWGTDFFLIPGALPPLLWLHRKLGLRTHDAMPTWVEIGLHWLVFSIVCEGIAPHFIARAVGDWGDILAYGVGAVLSGLVWKSSLR
jgi:hypothetical protein